ncbi:hypothetical protein Tco_0568928 [Tanacetum coccineum]
MTTLADKSLLSRGDNKPPMLEKHLYDSWKSRMELYMMNRPHGRMILASVEKGPLVWPSITEDGVTRLKEYVELTPAEAITSRLWQALTEEEIAFIGRTRLLDIQTSQTVITTMLAYQLMNLDAYDSDVNELNSSQEFPHGQSLKDWPRAPLRTQSRLI